MRHRHPLHRSAALALALGAALCLGPGTACSRTDDAPVVTATPAATTGSVPTAAGTTPAGTGVRPTNTTNSSAKPPGLTGTSIVGTDCQQVPATTIMSDKGGGHVICASSSVNPTATSTTSPKPDTTQGVVTGRLVRASGGSLAGLVDVEQTGLAYATGPDGSFGIPLAPGGYDLSVVINDTSIICPPQTVTIAADTTADVTFTCAP